MTLPTTPIDALHFDGRSARARPVCLRVDGRELSIESTEDGSSLRVPLKQVEWPERTRHGMPVAHLPEGGSLHPAEHLSRDTWQRWLEQAGQQPSFVVRAQQSWRSTLIALLLLVTAAGAAYQWGVPLLARAMLAAVPPSIDAQVGRLTLDSLYDRGWLAPSSLPAARQQALREAFAAALRRAEAAEPGSTPATWNLQFAAASKIGPNAFALPGGSIVVTDELVALLAGRDDALLGVLGHEAGHLSGRHGMRLLLQATLIGVATSVAFGDFSNLAATAPAVLGHLAYSRDFERQADARSIALMRANGISPTAMTLFFERMRERPDAPQREAIGIGLASHPPDEERMRAFEQAATLPR